MAKGSACWSICSAAFIVDNLVNVTKPAVKGRPSSPSTMECTMPEILDADMTAFEATLEAAEVAPRATLEAATEAPLTTLEAADMATFVALEEAFVATVEALLSDVCKDCVRRL
mmetsp:Transcript_19714/g.46846  ORF Transcript_19714/g.46846 Transcript_19714/m.46846 type:complete len:114 (+) Transcript_19714:1127-1468(+)